MSLDPLVNLSLKDAIAYDFFVTNVKDIIDAANEEKEKTISEHVTKLAIASYTLAEIFCETREQLMETSTDD